ncbi:MAG: hypothetical protein M3R38_30800 [Actinomycetota bacterium]|nr:hypothetical protein [Actinomycetota bacterium]
MEGYSYCYGHRPDLATERRRNASTGGRIGGRGRPQTETNALKKEIRSVIGGVLSGEIPQGQGAVALQGYNSLLRAQEQERRLEVGHITPEDLSKLLAQVVEVVRRHVPEHERFRAFSEEIGALLDEAAG